jgi:hypothetical protein
VNVVEDFLAAAQLPPGLSAFQPSGTVLLSSPRVTSGYATALLLDSSGEPRLVAKVSRRPLGRERLAAEYELLLLLAGRSAGVAPLPLALEEHRGHWLLLETAVHGPPATP